MNPTLRKFISTAVVLACTLAAAGLITPGIAAQAQRTAASFIVAPDGNEVRYKIREQLARVEQPNDAIGKTRQVFGRLAITRDGRIIPGESSFVVNVGTLESDKSFRDRYVRGRTMEATKFPTVEFKPTSLRGFPKVLPRSGSHSFEVLGTLRIKGVTRPSVWRVTASAGADRVTGTAVTAFTFADFQLSQPRVPVVLSVSDTIQLEYDFKLIPAR